MAQSPPRPTIRDVARRAGVSTTTVSDALNGRGRLPETTREHVSKVAQEMGYRARASARALRRGRSGQVALISPSLDATPDGLVGTGYYADLALGAARGALASDLALILTPPQMSTDRLLAFDVDGFIVSDPPLGHPVVAELAAAGARIVTCERDPTPGAAHAGCVRNDHPTALTALLEHLEAQGARRIALVAPGDEMAWAQELRATHRAWCRGRGVPAEQVGIPFTPRPAYAVDALSTLLAGTLPDAIVCAQDEGAATIVRELGRHGIRVPDDVLLASCVDGALVAAADPPVTAIDLQPGLIGQRAAEVLASVIDGEDARLGLEVEVPAVLRIRASTIAGRR